MKYWVYDLNDEYIEVEAAEASEDGDAVRFWGESGGLVGYFNKSAIMGFAPALKPLLEKVCEDSVDGKCCFNADNACFGTDAEREECAYKGGNHNG